jgi:hypothetical protein
MVFVAVMLNRRASRLGLVAMAAAVLAPTFASGRAAEHIPSNVLLFAQEKAKPFRGRVEAPRLACRDHRKVKVFRHSNNRLVGETRTVHRGKWSIPRRHAHGSFYAKAARVETKSRSGDKAYICRFDYSPTRHFGS